MLSAAMVKESEYIYLFLTKLVVVDLVTIFLSETLLFVERFNEKNYTNQNCCMVFRTFPSSQMSK